MRAPATQQFNIRAPRMRKLPLQPKWSNRNRLKGARMLRNTGLPVMATPLAIGLLTTKYFPMMVSEGWRLKDSPKPVGNGVEERSHVSHFPFSEAAF